MAVNIKKGSALDVINMTPMIDVVFQLLIFFLVATRFAEEERELDVQLPVVSEARPLTARPKETLVNIDAEGRFFVGTQPVTLAELDAILGRLATNNPGRKTVLIRGDKRSPLDSTAQVFNLCHKHGIRDYALTTDEAGD
ncbi:MAG: biopolymer transporter ExbD [Planctomycetota bacterium]|nr:MAG: biopolymer transporter ExbD [Planctomycetota bacterium]